MSLSDSLHLTWGLSWNLKLTILRLAILLSPLPSLVLRSQVCMAMPGLLRRSLNSSLMLAQQAPLPIELSSSPGHLDMSLTFLLLLPVPNVTVRGSLPIHLDHHLPVSVLQPCICTDGLNLPPPVCHRPACLHKSFRLAVPQAPLHPCTKEAHEPLVSTAQSFRLCKLG